MCAGRSAGLVPKHGIAPEPRRATTPGGDGLHGRLRRLRLASLLDRLRGRPIEHDLSAFRAVLARVSALEPAMAPLDDAGLTAWARALRARVADGAEVESQLPEAFALAREAARRALGQRPFDEQVLAGLALAQGRIVEMATGEGKTLAAVAPVFLQALAGRGAHVLTFNDYLARRDAAWMGPVYERLGLSVALRAGAHGRRRAAARLRRGRHVPHREGSWLRPSPRRPRPRAGRARAARVPLRPRGRGRLDPDRRGAHPARHRGRDGRGARRAREAGRHSCGASRPAAISTPTSTPTTSPSPRRVPLASRRRSGWTACTRSRASRSTPSSVTRSTPSTCCGATWTTSCGAARSSSWTSRPAASRTSATGPTACTPRSRPRRACGSAPRAASSGRSRCSTSSGSTRASPG